MSPSVYCGLNPSLGAISSVLNFSAIYHLFDVIPQFYLIDCPQATGLIFIKLKQIMGLGCVPVYSPPVGFPLHEDTMFGTICGLQGLLWSCLLPLHLPPCSLPSITVPCSGLRLPWLPGLHPDHS